ncbi:MAG: HesA/MoeB/ThiF family protein [Magnetococcales bacterium]|nr:HesA/MoeB/ThiF family protein [Magnetococcales bacterium]
MTLFAKEPDGVLLIGAGGLGCAAAQALAMIPITRLGMVDDDQVALSNLQRQVLYRMDDIGANKVERAKQRLQELAPGLEVDILVQRLDSPDAIADAARGYAVVLDGSDNFTTRFAANDAAIQGGFPLVHGAATGFAGQLMTIQPGHSACLRCLFTAPPQTTGPTCQTQGVLGPLVGEVGWLMAIEAVKLIYRQGNPLWNRLLTINALTGKRRTVPLRRNPHCPCNKVIHT